MVLVGETSSPSPSSATKEGKLVLFAVPTPALLDSGGDRMPAPPTPLALPSWVCLLKRPKTLFGIPTGAKPRPHHAFLLLLG